MKHTAFWKVHEIYMYFFTNNDPCPLTTSIQEVTTFMVIIALFSSTVLTPQDAPHWQYSLLLPIFGLQINEIIEATFQIGPNDPGLLGVSFYIESGMVCVTDC